MGVVSANRQRTRVAQGPLGDPTYRMLWAAQLGSAVGGNATYVYQFDYRPAQDPDRLGAAHCVELPFLFGTFDSYPDSPMLGTPSDTERVRGRSFATAVAAFVAAGSASDWLPYAPAATARIRHFG